MTRPLFFRGKFGQITHNENKGGVFFLSSVRVEKRRKKKHKTICSNKITSTFDHQSTSTITVGSSSSEECREVSELAISSVSHTVAGTLYATERYCSHVAKNARCCTSSARARVLISSKSCSEQSSKERNPLPTKMSASSLVRSSKSARKNSSKFQAVDSSSWACLSS